MMKDPQRSNFTRRATILGALAAFSIVVAVPALRSFKAEPRLGTADFERVRPGMTRADVEQQLGGPPRNLLWYRSIIWLPQARGRPISAEIGPEFPAVAFLVRESTPKSARKPQHAAALDFFPRDAGSDGEQAIWITRTLLVAVSFGPDGRVRDRYKSTVHEIVTPSFVDWLASRPRMIRRSLGF